MAVLWTRQLTRSVTFYRVRKQCNHPCSCLVWVMLRARLQRKTSLSMIVTWLLQRSPRRRGNFSLISRSTRTPCSSTQSRNHTKAASWVRMTIHRCCTRSALQWLQRKKSKSSETEWKILKTTIPRLFKPVKLTALGLSLKWMVLCHPSRSSSWRHQTLGTWLHWITGSGLTYMRQEVKRESASLRAWGLKRLKVHLWTTSTDWIWFSHSQRHLRTRCKGLRSSQRCLSMRLSCAKPTNSRAT